MHLQVLGLGLSELVFGGLDSNSMELMKQLVNAIEAKEAPPLSWDHSAMERSSEKTLTATMRCRLIGYNLIYRWDFSASALEPKAIEVIPVEKDAQSRRAQCVCGQCEHGKCRCVCRICGLDGGDCRHRQRCRTCELLCAEWDRDWRRTWRQGMDWYDFGRGTVYMRRKPEVKDSYELFVERVRWKEYIG